MSSLSSSSSSSEDRTPRDELGELVTVLKCLPLFAFTGAGLNAGRAAELLLTLLDDLNARLKAVEAERGD